MTFSEIMCLCGFVSLILAPFTGVTTVGVAVVFFLMSAITS